MMTAPLKRRYALAVTVVLLAQVSLPLCWSEKAPLRASASIMREFRAADMDMQTGRYDKAEGHYTAILKKQPYHTKARSALALAQAELYKLDAAEKNARQALAKDPRNAMAHVALGVVARNRTASSDMTYRGNRDAYLAESARELEEAVRLDPNSPEAHNQLGVTYRFQGRMHEAMHAFQRAARLDPRFAEAIVNQGIAQLEQGNVSEAKRLFDQAVKLNSKNHMAHYRLGEAYLRAGDPHLALRSLNTALALNPNNAAVMTKMAEAYTAQDNTSAAVASYRKAIQSNPGFMPAYIGISNLFDSRGDGELAMAELRSALNANSKYHPARNQLGRLALTVDKPDQALQYYKESLQANPNDAEALQGMSQALMTIAQKSASTSQFTGAESDLVMAEQTVQEALRLNPNDLRLHLASLRISQLAGKPAHSEAELQQILAKTAQTDSERMLQGQALLAVGRYDQADQVFRGLMQQHAKNPDQLLIIGDTLKLNGDLERAKEAYRAALSVDPGNLKADRGIRRIEAAEADSQRSLRLAKALNNWRQRESSIDFYEETLAKNPRQPMARLALAKLYEKYKQYDKAILSYQHYLGLVPNLTEKDRQYYQKKINKLQELAHRTQFESRPITQASP